MKIKLETGVPIPTKRAPGKKRGEEWTPYPWDVMKVGQSFLFPKTIASQSSGRAMAYSAGIRYRRKFLARVCKDGLRAWRIK